MNLMKSWTMLKELKGNIQPFDKEFICAGSRRSLIGLYRKLIDLGANISETDKVLLASGNPVVLFCKNTGINRRIAEVRVFNRTWWDYWHNPRNKKAKPKYKTYNLPKQWDIVIDLIILKEIPTYEADTVD